MLYAIYYILYITVYTLHYLSLSTYIYTQSILSGKTLPDRLHFARYLAKLFFCQISGKNLPDNCHYDCVLHRFCQISGKTFAR